MKKSYVYQAKPVQKLHVRAALTAVSCAVALSLPYAGFAQMTNSMGGSAVGSTTADPSMTHGTYGSTTTGATGAVDNYRNTTAQRFAPTATPSTSTSTNTSTNDTTTATTDTSSSR